MQGRIIMLLTVAAVATTACSKGTSYTADTGMAATPAPVDTKADAAAIVKADSTWLRNVMAKNVDSLMTLYAPDAVSFGGGTAPVAGMEQLRAAYTEFVKPTISDPKLNSNTVKFSDDGKMAYDYGTYSLTVTPPGGKPAKENGGYLNVWRKVDGQWKMVIEMSTPVPAPKT